MTPTCEVPYREDLSHPPTPRSLGPSPGLDSAGADVGDALGSHGSREGSGFRGAVRAIAAPVTPVKVEERPCRDPRPFPPRPPHLLPRQGRPPAPGHLGGKGGGPSRGAEVLRGDGQKLGDAELLGHGGRGAGAPGLLERGAGGARCTELGGLTAPPPAPSGPLHAPPPPRRSPRPDCPPPARPPLPRSPELPHAARP